VELVEAQQWVQANSNLHGRQLTDAARQQNWDPSVQALVAMPDVLAKLTSDIRWTTDLGDAFLAQQADVMAAVQRMRSRAQANGRLRSTSQETVTCENQGGQPVIEIQPANPQVIYVPAYDPYYVWGPPVWGVYPALYYPGAGFWWGPGIDIGFYFGGWGGWGFGGWGWGWGPNWFGHSVFVNNYFFNRYGYRGGYGFGGRFAGRAAWVHDPAHRLGVAYPNRQLSNRFGAASQASRMAVGRSGNWRGYSGAGNVANRNSFRGAPSSSFRSPASNSFRGPASQSAGRSFQAARGPSNAGRSYQPSAQRNYAPAQRSSAPAQRSYAPAQRYQAPQQHFQSAPHASAPRSSGGGGGFRGGGGSAYRSSGGGGGGGSHGGGGHSGRR